MKIEKMIEKFLLTLISIVMFILVMGALWQVFSRFVLNNPSVFTEELLRFALIWAGMLGAVYGFMKNQHMALVFFPNKLKGRAKAALNLVTDGIIVFFCMVVLVKGGMSVASGTMGQSTPILGLPMGMVYSILPITGVMITIIKGIHIFHCLMVIAGKSKANERGGVA